MNRNRKGFTLIEILIVLVVLAVLATLAIPGYISTIERSRRQEALQALAATRDSLLRDAALHGDTFPTITTGTNFSALDFDPNERPGGVHRHYNYTIVSGAVSASTGTNQPTPPISAATNGFVVTALRNDRDFVRLAGVGNRAHDMIQITEDGVIHYSLVTTTATAPAAES